MTTTLHFLEKHELPNSVEVKSGRLVRFAPPFSFKIFDTFCSNCRYIVILGSLGRIFKNVNLGVFFSNSAFLYGFKAGISLKMVTIYLKDDRVEIKMEKTHSSILQ